MTLKSIAINSVVSNDQAQAIQASLWQLLETGASFEQAQTALKRTLIDVGLSPQEEQQ